MIYIPFILWGLCIVILVYVLFREIKTPRCVHEWDKIVPKFSGSTGHDLTLSEGLTTKYCKNCGTDYFKSNKKQP